MVMDEILAYLESAVKLYALNVFIAMLIVLIGRWVAGLLRNGLSRIMKRRNIDETLTRFTGSVMYAVILVVVIIAALAQLGIQTTSLIAILGAAGLAIGLALQGSLSNLASGIMLIMLRPFRAGHFIEGAGISGSVQEVGLFTTELLSPDNRRIIVPNSRLTGDNIINYTVEEKRRIDMFFTVGYGDNLQRAKEVMEAVLREDERILDDPAPLIGVLELSDNAVKFAVRPWTRTADYWPVYFSIMQEMKQRLMDAGLNIPYPQRDVHLYHHKDETSAA
jgi:small conductance mechanosensitive channel